MDGHERDLGASPLFRGQTWEQNATTLQKGYELDHKATTLQKDELDHETTPLLKKHPETRGYSSLRVLIVACLVPTFYMSCLIALMPLLSQYIVDRLAKEENSSFKQSDACHANKSDPDVVNADEIQSKSTTLLMYCNFAQCIPAAIACLLLGSFSDVLGRRKVLMGCLFTGVIKTLSCSILIRLTLPTWVLYITWGIDGIAGSWFIMYVALYSAVADVCSSQQQRVLAMSVIGCSLSVVSSLSVILGGYAIKAFGFFTASLILTGLMTLSFLIALIFLPETMPTPTSKEKNYNLLNNVKRTLSFFFFQGSARTKATFALCLSMFFFSVINVVGSYIVDPLYQLRRPFCWGPQLIGWYDAAKLGGQYVLGLTGLRLLQYCVRDETIAKLGSFLQGVSLGFEAFITHSWEFALVPSVGFLGVTTVPIIRAMMSSLVGATEQGAVFSSIAVIEALCSAGANTAIYQVYSVTVSYMAGAVYLLLMSFSAMTFILLFVYDVVKEERKHAHEIILDSVNE